jgi:hypothetical protein
VFDPMPPTQIAEMNTYLNLRFVHANAHVPQTGRTRNDPMVPREDAIALGSECFCTSMNGAILTPHLLETALAHTDLVAAYLGCDPPVMYSINVFWTRPGPAAARKDIQEFHRDKDDERFVTMFVFLTDVFEDGAQDIEGPDGVIRGITGPAGATFLSDTSRQHRGRKPTRGERGIAWVRWGVSDPPAAYVWDGNEPVSASELGDRYPEDQRLRESMRLIAS